MYRNIHITLNRDSMKSSYSALTKSAEEVDNGQNLVFFPEGGILSKNPPKMARFKDGAFRLAKEKQIPIVPITIPYNWILLPDDGKFLLHPHRNEIKFHEPIDTQGLTMSDLHELKSKVYRIISDEIQAKNPGYEPT